MKAATQADIKPKPGSSPEEVAHLEMMRTMEVLSHRFAQVLKAEDLSSTQYNVLRILRAPRRDFRAGRLATAW